MLLQCAVFLTQADVSGTRMKLETSFRISAPTCCVQWKLDEHLGTRLPRGCQAAKARFGVARGDTEFGMTNVFENHLVSCAESRTDRITQ